jgi:hypothetical protein
MICSFDSAPTQSAIRALCGDVPVQNGQPISVTDIKLANMTSNISRGAGTTCSKSILEVPPEKVHVGVETQILMTRLAL